MRKHLQFYFAQAEDRSLAWRIVLLVVLNLLLAAYAAYGQDEACAPLWPEGTVHLYSSDCAPQSYCLPIPLQNAPTYSLSDNGLPYGGGFSGCRFDTVIAYTYFTLLGQGNAGPYFLESWTVNGTSFSGHFPNIQALADSMNLWDPAGQWQLLPTALLIIGGANNATYSVMTVQQLQIAGTFAQIGFNQGLTALGTSITLDTGFHQLYVLNTVSGCVDSLQIYVHCGTQEAVSLSLLEGDSAQYCVTWPGMDTVFALCVPDSSIVQGQWSPDGDAFCFDYQGLRVGQAQFCWVGCQNGSICDTLVLNIQVLPRPKAWTASVQVGVGNTSQYCLDAARYAGFAMSLSFCQMPNETLVEYFLDADALCVEYTGTGAGAAQACVLVCSDAGWCDTLYLQVQILNTAITLVAEDDAAEGQQDQALIIPVLANDFTGGGTGTSLDIIVPPAHGQILINPDLSLSYLPEAGYCGDDVFTYEICNPWGCDLADVQIYLRCDDIIIYSGISPNGDGLNDQFVIKGLDNYESHSLEIFNRWGNRVFFSDNYRSDWEGIWENVYLSDGTYFYTLVVADSEGKKNYSGWLQIKR